MWFCLTWVAFTLEVVLFFAVCVLSVMALGRCYCTNKYEVCPSKRITVGRVSRCLRSMRLCMWLVFCVVLPASGVLLSLSFFAVSFWVFVSCLWRGCVSYCFICYCLAWCWFLAFILF